MRIFVKAKPSAKEQFVQKIDENHYVVSVTEPPVGGKANLAIVRAVAGYFGVGILQVNIVSGRAAKQKIIEIL